MKLGLVFGSARRSRFAFAAIALMLLPAEMAAQSIDQLPATVANEVRVAEQALRARAQGAADRQPFEHAGGPRAPSDDDEAPVRPSVSARGARGAAADAYHVDAARKTRHGHFETGNRAGLGAQVAGVCGDACHRRAQAAHNAAVVYVGNIWPRVTADLNLSC